MHPSNPLVLRILCLVGALFLFQNPLEAAGPETAHAAAMALEANLSFEQAAGPETEYVDGWRTRLPWVKLANRADWPAAWLVREVSLSGGKRALDPVKQEHVAAVSAPFSLANGTAHTGTRSLLIQKDTGKSVFTMGEVAFPVAVLRNYFRTNDLIFHLTGWVKGENAEGSNRMGLEFSQHSEGKNGSRASDSARAPGGTFDWTRLDLTMVTKAESGRWARITLEAPGLKGKIWWDDLSLTVNGEDIFAVMAKVRTWRDGTSSTARLIAALPAASIWTEDPGQKVFTWSEPAAEKATLGIDWTAAAGEYESLQLAIKPSTDLSNLQVTFSGLTAQGTGVIPKEHLSVREVALVKRPGRWDFIDPSGMIPDPLRPSERFSFIKNDSRSLWLTLSVPPKARAGIYKGVVTLSGPLNLSIPVRLVVRGFSLPERSPFLLNAEIKPKCVALYDKRPWTVAMKDYFPDMAAHRARATTYEIFPIPVVQDGRVTLDAVSVAESDAIMDYALSLGFHTFFTSKSPFYLGGAAEKQTGAAIWKDTPWAAQKYDTGVKRTDPEFRRLYGDFLAQCAAHYKKRGTLTNILQYLFDEPFLWAKTPAQKQEVKEIYDLSKESGFRNFLTTHPTSEYGAMDTWCPLYYRAILETNAKAEAQAAGQKVIWYHNEFYTVNRSALQARLVGWFTWRYAFDGYLIWSLNYWPDGDPWTQVRLDGDGQLLYPNPAGDGKPCSSIRWELMREGIEDFEYFHILKARADSILSNATSSPSLKERALASRRLLSRMEALIPFDASTLSHSLDPAAYGDLRAQVAQAIEDLGEAP